MLHLFLSHLLGIWLLLSQLPREVPGETDKLIRACGRELVRIRIELCGTMPWRKRDQGQKPLLEFEQLTGESSCPDFEAAHAKMFSFPLQLAFLVWVP